MTTIVPIEHAGRGRRGVIVRRGARVGEASPLPGRSKESLDDVVQAIALGDATLASVDFAEWTLGARLSGPTIGSQELLDDPSTALPRARASSASAFKVKIRSRADADVLVALRDALPRARLRADANRAFERESDVPWDVLVRAGVEWIEEPCADAGSLAGAPVPIALDESVEHDADRALEDVRDARATALVLKPTILGASATLRIGRACLALGGRVVVSHAFESELGRRGAEALARELDPRETHGLARWDGIDAYRLVIGGAPVATLWSDGVDHAVG